MRRTLAIAVLLCPLLAKASAFDETKLFMEDNRALATAVGIMKFCRNSGLEGALMQKAGRSVVDAKLKSPGSANDVDVYLQALDFQAVGVATGIKISGISEPAQRNLCSLGVQLADKLLAAKAGE